ncbi:class II fumarate hydratase [Atopobium fossor]|uniref:class II fumarate hydratase n=1 Tax=Atopobium fossor TaxID=39487 RepID=UPI000428922F|nr:class II fumarate hydratase [Atopobium fossor]
MENIEKDSAFRVEHDSLGEVLVDASHFWGAQTQRSYGNFCIGQPQERMPFEIIYAFAQLKKACALANYELNPTKMTQEKCQSIVAVCDKILAGELSDEFPLVVYQTGSGTQTNMNVNEVVANVTNLANGQGFLHPNDDVNMSQSSNDTFPSAMHIAFVTQIESKLIPSLKQLIAGFEAKEHECKGVIKSGRTHLMDAVPISFSQELSGYRFSLQQNLALLQAVLVPLKQLAIGATAVGTGLNAPLHFDVKVCEQLQKQTNSDFVPCANKFHALTSLDEVVAVHGVLKALAMDLFKIANDIRLMASGPRCGLNEVILPANEPGSSIMPGKVNPTQCEQVTQVAVQVFGNDASIGFAASQGQFELNVFLPVTAYNFLQSVRLLSSSMDSFLEHCLQGLRANESKMTENLNRSLMLSTLLSPSIGYEKSAQCALLAHNKDISLKEAVLELGYLSSEAFDQIYHPEQMI